ncbi:MAG: molybdate ABC transporter substrate-binding protein [Alphaproteobacteria bacterium]|nr:molybdate ABC transporter substrate-binding protein [Alphaproteobacteria bacterium]
MRRFSPWATVALAAVLCLTRPAIADTVRVAVASNFLATLLTVGSGFTAATGHVVEPVAGSSGKLYAQIHEAAPFDVFLSADADRPARLIAEGLADGGSRFTYAFGRLALWSHAAASSGHDCWQVLRDGHGKIAIANPTIAPYGAAAKAVLVGQGLWLQVTDRIVQGNDLAQAYQFVATENAEIGFVGLSQVRAVAAATGCLAEVPAGLHPPIRQDAVLLRTAANPDAAKAFLAYLKSRAGRAVIAADGYDTE